MRNDFNSIIIEGKILEAPKRFQASSNVTHEMMLVAVHSVHAALTIWVDVNQSNGLIPANLENGLHVRIVGSMAYGEIDAQQKALYIMAVHVEPNRRMQS